MVAIRTAEATGGPTAPRCRKELFSDAYLIRRPLLEALEPQEAGRPSC
jgi:hypothetical protein